ncbi:PREDICTED: leukocyte immunoglobulin-like receptor subfamily A member 6-like [Chrysochloris asiatica]|uniref:Leukocyte immunoglobulin-like receptor subfamily A member 6-like n=1 Tax=Chrysochloris asiatica TaxID=185453 RepID=A0A9B0WV46_CHRAS|nr:PREDICTED: leukocyte immunoglobulin-like receptor subfamily A member 6-like [Chrysochloris asiatica]
MTAILTALLCLGLSLGQEIQAQARTNPKPTIWAEPGAMIILKTPVTIWCQGSVKAEEYYLEREGIPVPWEKVNTLKSRNKVNFFIEQMTTDYAGRYYCYYFSRSGWSAYSEPLDLMATGAYVKPTVVALLSPVVSSGGNVTLECASQMEYDMFVLYEEEEHKHFWTLFSQHSSGLSQAVFPVGPVIPGHRWTFKCYGCYRNNSHVLSIPSDTLKLLISDVYKKPTLTASPSQVVRQGQCVTLQCLSPLGLSMFWLYKEDGPLAPELKNARLMNNFLMDPVTPAHAGIYRCRGSYHSSMWSALSDPLEITVTGVYRKPSLLAQPGALMKRGQNVSLRCCSEVRFDTYMLQKTEEKKENFHLVKQIQGRKCQADFSLGAMTAASVGTYRCYGSHKRSPFEWSAPSDPLELLITGVHTKPSLLAQPDLVKLGENVTLRCFSELKFDTYMLCKEEGIADSMRLAGKLHGGSTQANFSLSSRTSAYVGTYRCYGSFRNSPLMWSAASDPLKLVTTEISPGVSPPPTESSHQPDSTRVEEVVASMELKGTLNL